MNDNAKAPDKSKRPPLTGYVLAAGGAILFSAKGVLIKLAYAENVDAITLLTLRMLLSAPIFIAVGLWAVYGRSAGKRPFVTALDLVKASLIGILGYWFASYADFKGLETLSPQFERLILFTYPLFVVIFGVLIFRYPFKPAALAAFGISYLGLAVIFVKDMSLAGSSVAVGAVWVLVSAVAFAFYQLFAKGMIGRLGAPLFTSVAMTAASFVVVSQYVMTCPLAGLMVSSQAFLIAVGVAIGATVLPTFLMNAALSRISAQANSTIGTLSPVVTLMLAVVVLGEVVTPVDLIGTALVIGGIGAFTFVDRRKSRRKPAPKGRLSPN